MNTFANASLTQKLLGLFLIIAGLLYAKSFLMPLCIGGIIATLFLPFCHWMERKNLPKGLAVFICVLVLLLGITALGALLGWKIVELLNDIALIKKESIAVLNNVQDYIFRYSGISAARQFQFLRNEQPSLTDIMQAVAGSFSYVLTNFIFVLAYVFFLLYYRAHIKRFILKLAAPSGRDEVENILSRATLVSQQYLVGLSKMIVCLWVMYGIGFSILGVENALYFAVLCGLLEIIPFIGNITGTALTVLVTALHGASLPVLGGIIVVYGIVQFIQGWALEPLILGAQVKINPLFTVIALLLGDLLWGIPGVILAIPLTAIFKIVCDSIEPLKPYGFLIGAIETETETV
jgi:predicted PurR-regulated permease PerM